MGKMHKIEKVLSREEWESWKVGMSDEFGRLQRDVGTGDRSEPAKPVQPMEYATTNRMFYVAGVGIKDGSFYFHFYPATQAGFRPDFADKLGDAFIDTFKATTPTWDFVPEVPHPGDPTVLGSWVVKVEGYASKPLAHNLFSTLFDTLDRYLEV